MPKAARTRAQQRRLEWALLALALLCLVAWLSPPQQMAGLNHLVQDLGLRSLARPPHPDIVVIAVDDRSITSIGRWPWRRALHAQLVDVVTAQNPKAIGLDILFSEPDLDYPLDDALLAQVDALEQAIETGIESVRGDIAPLAERVGLLGSYVDQMVDKTRETIALKSGRVRML